MKFKKALHELCNDYWKQEVDEARSIFDMDSPDLTEYKYDNRKAEAWLNWAVKRDNARKTKLTLLKTMVQMMDSEFSNNKDEVDMAHEEIKALITEAEKRIN